MSGSRSPDGTSKGRFQLKRVVGVTDNLSSLTDPSPQSKSEARAGSVTREAGTGSPGRGSGPGLGKPSSFSLRKLGGVRGKVAQDKK